MSWSDKMMLESNNSASSMKCELGDSCPKESRMQIFQGEKSTHSSQNGLGWKIPLRTSSYNLASTVSDTFLGNLSQVCSKPHPTWDGESIASLSNLFQYLLQPPAPSLQPHCLCRAPHSFSQLFLEKRWGKVTFSTHSSPLVCLGHRQQLSYYLKPLSLILCILNLPCYCRPSGSVWRGRRPCTGPS